jgi:hypothetical protein
MATFTDKYIQLATDAAEQRGGQDVAAIVSAIDEGIHEASSETDFIVLTSLTMGLRSSHYATKLREVALLCAGSAYPLARANAVTLIYWLLRRGQDQELLAILSRLMCDSSGQVRRNAELIAKRL